MACVYRWFYNTKKYILKPNFLTIKQQKSSASRFVEIGHLEDPNVSEKNYEPGQLFIHKLFAYRGVVLFHWHAKIYDNDINESHNKPGNVRIGRRGHNKECFYYQVLIDSRDRSYVKNFLQNDAVTFLGKTNEKRSIPISSLPGMDYVSHEDILPYSSTTQDTVAVQHELFDKFFDLDYNKQCCFSTKPSLKTWHSMNSPWLDLSQVYIETTEDVRVTAIPFYIGYQKTRNSKKYWWRYMIRLENMGKLQMQLLAHHWRVIGTFGLLETVRGPGVVGQEPFLSKVFPIFQYNSHVSLYSPHGHMWGTYEMERENGKLFECLIPVFALNSKDDINIPLTSLNNS